MPEDLLRFYERPNPSANSVLLLGPQPMLVDSGFGSDVFALENWLVRQEVPAAQLHLLVNTHHHCDHVGGNHALQTRHGLNIAAHPWEAQAVNRRHPDAGQARWINQPIQAYRVQHLLRDGDTLSTGLTTWQVIHTPGHSQGHISLYNAEHRTLIAGDAALDGDVGWINLLREGLAAFEQSVETVERLSGLDIQTIYPGHGPVITEPERVLNAARARLEKWNYDPVKIGWHACKRIMAFALMYHGGMTSADLDEYLHRSPWFHDYARDVFNQPPHAFQEQLVKELLRSGAARWHDGRLNANGPHVVPPPGWATTPTTTAEWDA